MSQRRPKILILGTRGIPAAHGGFETFAQRLALFLSGNGWDVGVYCQTDGAVGGHEVSRDSWNGVERINIAVHLTGPKATLLFDWLSVRDAARQDAICLVLGYNGAVFLPYLRLFGRPVITNMDGIEWRRPKWGPAARLWFYFNEKIAARASHRLVADHPEIARHLSSRYKKARISMVPYGGDPVEGAPVEPLTQFGLEPNGYLLLVARIEPDNNILPVIEAFSRQRRGVKLAVVGGIDHSSRYGQAIVKAAGDEVTFLGPVYEPAVLSSLRFHAKAYIHGHMVGGTNPSLVEALWAGNAILAHDNRFNRWTAAEAALFFHDAESCASLIGTVLGHPDLLSGMRSAARRHAAEAFMWDDVLTDYENLFLQMSTSRVDRLPAPAMRLKRRSV